MRIHLTTMGYVVALAFALKLERAEFAVLFLTIAFVISLEMINTAIEKLCDFNQSQYDNQIRIIKDISAGAVLVAALFAIFVGISILGKPTLWKLVMYLLVSPRHIFLLLCTILISLIFIFIGPVGIWERLHRMKK